MSTDRQTNAITLTQICLVSELIFITIQSRNLTRYFAKCTKNNFVISFLKTYLNVFDVKQ